jgi:hypothetical protein
MGLGKTLTMIASIVTGLSSAEEFKMRKQLYPEQFKPSLVPVQSTLVVVPSVCQDSAFPLCQSCC